MNVIFNDKLDKFTHIPQIYIIKPIHIEKIKKEIGKIITDSEQQEKLNQIIENSYDIGYENGYRTERRIGEIRLKNQLDRLQDFKKEIEKEIEKLIKLTD